MCVITRSARASPLAARQAQGRPLGLMVAWCRAVESCALHNKDAHKANGLDFEARAAARACFAGLPGSAWYLRQERPLQEGEGAELGGRP